MFIIAEGDLPICLCAHIDTVFASPPTTFYYDNQKNVLWSPEGLGADDRAGIYAIIELIEEGFRPSIILTDLEERGGIGADTLTKFYPECPFDDCRALIQLDRKGKDEAVYYDCDNKDFEKLITSYGFKTDWGTFTDISIIAPAWKIAAVNLSVGYLNEHQKIETLNLRQLDNTIKKVGRMLRECGKWLSYAYIPFDYSKMTFNDTCIVCNKKIPANTGHICYSDKNFVSNLVLCDECYNLYYVK